MQGSQVAIFSDPCDYLETMLKLVPLRVLGHGFLD